MIPGPLLLGKVLDAVCDIWGKSCSQEMTSCLIYDNEVAARNLSLFSASIGVSVILSMLIAFACYKMSARSKSSSEPSR